MPIDRYEFGGLFFSLVYQHSRLERAMSRESGLYSGQPRVLTILKDNEGCTLSELSERCGIGLPSLSVSVRNMERGGLIRKVASKSDNRAQTLFLTDTGLAKARRFHELIDSFYSRLIDGLGEEGSLRARDTLERLVAFIKVADAEFSEPD